MNIQPITPHSKNLAASLTLGQLEKSESSSVWVLNNTEPKGNVNITMNDGQGASLVVTVPVTWIPIDLTTQATKTALINSPHFRRMLSINALLLVGDDQAEITMAAANAQKEAGRVYSRVLDLAGAIDVNTMPAAAAKASTESSGNISGMAMQLAMATDLDEDQVMTTLQGNASSMSDQDMQYLAENSRFPRVKEYAAAHLAG